MGSLSKPHLVPRRRVLVPRTHSTLCDLVVRRRGDDITHQGRSAIEASTNSLGFTVENHLTKVIQRCTPPPHLGPKFKRSFYFLEVGISLHAGSWCPLCAPRGAVRRPPAVREQLLPPRPPPQTGFPDLASSRGQFSLSDFIFCGRA